jgi:hypothetical protein
MVFQMNKREKIFRIIGLTLLAFVLIAFAPVACQRGEETETGEKEAAEQEGIITFEGTVKIAEGKYVFVPEASGFDIVIQGNLETGGTESLVDKQVRGEGEISPERPSILIVNTLEIMEENGTWRTIFTRTEDVVLEDFLDLSGRGEFETLEDLSYDKKSVWEGKEKVKVYGRLEKTNGGNVIAVLDEEGAESGKILVDSFTVFGNYYLKKLRLFDKFWFYMKVKETIDWSERRRTREMFHADVVFAGLF